MTSTDFNTELLLLHKKLKGYAIKLTCDTIKAEDLLQDTLLKAIENRLKFNDGTNLNAWLLVMMRNIFINNCRRQSYGNNIFDKSEDCFSKPSACQQMDFTNDPMSLVSHKEIMERVDLLSEKRRASFLMFMQGYQYGEIAEKFDVPVGTIKSRIFNTRKFMMSELEDLVS